jgi:hypothetical protein
MEGPNLPNVTVTRSRRGVLFGDKLRKMNCYAVLFCEKRRWQRIGAVMCPRELERGDGERGRRPTSGLSFFSEIFKFSHFDF